MASPTADCLPVVAAPPEERLATAGSPAVAALTAEREQVEREVRRGPPVNGPSCGRGQGRGRRFVVSSTGKAQRGGRHRRLYVYLCAGRWWW